MCVSVSTCGFASHVLLIHSRRVPLVAAVGGDQWVVRGVHPCRCLIGCWAVSVTSCKPRTSHRPKGLRRPAPVAYACADGISCCLQQSCVYTWFGVVSLQMKNRGCLRRCTNILIQSQDEDLSLAADAVKGLQIGADLGHCHCLCGATVITAIRK